MQQQDDTTSGPVTLRVEPRHAPFLREHFEIHRAGRLGDLVQPYGTDDATLERIRALAETCGRIIDGIDRGEIVADPEVSAVLADEAAVNDRGDNDYERVVAEHEAFAHLLDQLADPHAYRQRLVLRALLEPSAFGGFLGDLAVRLDEREPDVETAALALEDRGLATVRNRYVAASGCSMEFDALWPERRGEGDQ